MLAASRNNAVNYSVHDDGAHVGFVMRYSVGRAAGWYFVAASRDLVERYPETDNAHPTVKACIDELAGLLAGAKVAQ